MIKGLIFDMDGVVLDSEPIHGKVVEQIFIKYEIDISKEEHEAFIGGTSYAMWSALADQFNLSVTPEQLLAEDQEKYLEKLSSMNSLQPIEGVQQLMELATLEELTIGLASSATRANVDLVLKKLGLNDMISISVSGDEVNHSKPHPEIFNTAARKIDIHAAHVLVIEDSENGVEAAKKAGMRCIGYVNSNSGNQNLHSADWLINDIHQAITIINENIYMP